MPSVSADLDCRHCGACCISNWDLPGYVALTPTEVKRLSEWKRAHWIHYEHNDWDGTFPALRTKENKQSHIVCIAFRGSIGKQCSCSIYDDRPKPCRGFKPGSMNCREAREATGLEE